jgi:hypothetical protein
MDDRLRLEEQALDQSDARVCSPRPLHKEARAADRACDKIMPATSLSHRAHGQAATLTPLRIGAACWAPLQQCTNRWQAQPSRRSAFLRLAQTFPMRDAAGHTSALGSLPTQLHATLRPRESPRLRRSQRPY